MKTSLTALSFILLPLPLAAQEVCAAPEPFPIPACMAGAWVGESDMAEKMQAILASVPEHMRAHMGGDMGRYLFMAIYPDGYFATSPLEGRIDGVLLSDRLAETDFTMEQWSTPGAGWMWVGESGGMGFCTNPGAGMGMLDATATNPEGTNHGAAFTGFAPGGFAPTMTALCDGDYLQILIDLPEPIGTVTYSMTRIPDAAMPAELRALYADRFGG